MNMLPRWIAFLLLPIAGSEGFAQEPNFQGREVFRVNFEGKDLTNANFRNAVIKESNFGSAILKNADFRFASIRGGSFRKADLTGADFRDAKIDNPYFTSVDLSNANFEGVDLGAAPLIASKLVNANLRNLKLSVNIIDCDLTGADLRGANLRGMAVWRGTIFRNVRVDSATIWPASFDPKLNGIGEAVATPVPLDPNDPKPKLSSKIPDPAAKQKLFLKGDEDLPGFGPLAFRLDGAGKAEMFDASKELTRGTYRIAGNRYTMTFPGVVYEGAAEGKAISGKARNEKGGVWNFKVAIETDQPATPTADPTPAVLLNPPPGAKLPLDGLYLKIYQASGRAIQELYYFTKEGRASIRPFGGVNPFDWAGQAKSHPGYNGIYSVEGNNIVIRTGDGNTRKQTFDLVPAGVNLGGYLAQKLATFPPESKLSGRWTGTNSSVFGKDRVESGWQFDFGKDGTYELDRQGIALGGADTSTERGTYSLSGNTLRLAPTQGPARNMTIFPYEAFGGEQRFNIEGMFFRQSKK